MSKPEIVKINHPRPDFYRKNWISLDGEWDFSFEQPVFDRKIMVPFCYQSEKSGIGIAEDHYIVWYRKDVSFTKEQTEFPVILLKFGAVDTKAEVWVNENYLGSHEGGYTPFEFNIAPYVREGKNEIRLKAEDYKNADKPRGKQTWKAENFACWYTAVTGIWQSVWLEFAGGTYIKKIKITPETERLTALCEVFLSDYEETEAQIQVQLPDGEDHHMECRIVCRNGYGKASLAFPDYDLRREELLWTPEFPNLIDVKVKLPNDQVNTYFGMRSVESLNGCLTLNHDIYYQRLVLDQGYWKESLLTPPDEDAIIKDILLTKEMGFNGARKHQKIEDPRYYYWADKLGLLVWGELPSAYDFNDNAIKASARDMVEFIERDYNHPCIAAWVPVNESWGVRNIQADARQQNYCRMLTYLIKALDPVRLVSSNDGWEQIEDTDICAIHDYALFENTMNKYDDMERILKTFAERRHIFAEENQYQGQPVMMTEFGGIAFCQDEENGWGYYEGVRNEEEFFNRLEPVVTYLIRSGRFSGFCYTQLTDVMQEVNGLLTEEREPKADVKKLKEIFSKRIY